MREHLHRTCTAPAWHCSTSAAPVRRGAHPLTSHMLMQALHKLHHCTCPRAACCIDAPALRMRTARAHVMQHARTARASDPRRLPRTASAKQAMPVGRLSVKPAKDLPIEVIEWPSAFLTCTVALLLSIAALPAVRQALLRGQIEVNVGNPARQWLHAKLAWPTVTPRSLSWRSEKPQATILQAFRSITAPSNTVVPADYLGSSMEPS